jgi:two-component system sensor histidine kinase/response regulator
MFLRQISLLVMFLLSLNGFSQHNEADSLQNIIRSISSDTVKVNLLNTLVTSFGEKDNNLAFEFALEAKVLAGALLYQQGMAQALENLGLVMYRKGEYSKAFEYSSQSLKINEELHSQSAIARNLINIATVYYRQGQYIPGIESSKRAYSIVASSPDKRTIARSLNSIAKGVLYLGKLDSATIYVQRALRMSKQEGYWNTTATSYRILGDINLAKITLSAALEYYTVSLGIAEKYKNTVLKVSALQRLGNVYKMMGRYDKAIEYLSQGVASANVSGFKDELERSYKLISEIYTAKNDIGSAFEYQSKYIAIHDSLYDQKSVEQMALMEARFDAELKEAQIDLLKKETKLKQDELNVKTIWAYFYMSGLILAIILAFVLYYKNRYTRKAKLVLEERNMEIQKQTQQLRNLNSTKDKLFSIISHDLRSPVASLRALMELLGTSQLSQQEFINITNALKRNLDSVYDDLDNLLLWATTQLKGLQALPEIVCIKTIADEKIKLFYEAAKMKDITIINDIPEEAEVYADRNHISLILRNLIANAIKFNLPGGCITLSSKEQDGNYEISITDSGTGISSEELKKLFNAETHFSKLGTNKEKGVGIGLLLTKEFVERNQGSIRVASEVGKGTTFTFTAKACRTMVLV